ncbi:hypothetical protein BHM03_00032067 [Ensete ventricosum]|nr:hypothetical protein BHM03_00032067 [Ensete ventricosum]
MVYSYRHGFSGFAAMLNSTQASTLASGHITISIQTLNHHPPLLNALMGTALAGRYLCSGASCCSCTRGGGAGISWVSA